MSALGCYCQGEDGVISVYWHLQSQTEEVQVRLWILSECSQIIHLQSVFPQHAGKNLRFYNKLHQKAQQGVSVSVCSAHAASECVHRGSPMSVLKHKNEYAEQDSLLIHGC